MAWRNHSTHKEETKAVKAALVKAGYADARVGHGSGTAWGWLDLKVSIAKPHNCYCGELSIGRCRPCGDAWQQARNQIIGMAQAITGRHGDHDGDIGAHIDWR